MTNSDIFKNTVFDHASPVPMIICSFLTGFLFAILVDAFSFTDRFFGKNKIIRFFTDFVSVVISYLFLFVSAFNFNNGIIRWFSIAGVVVAINLYKKYASKPFLALFGKVFDLAEKTIRFCLSLLIFPIKKAYALMTKIYRLFYEKTKSVLRKMTYKREKNKISSKARVGFHLVPQLKEDKKWNRTEKTKREKKSASRRRLRSF